MKVSLLKFEPRFKAGRWWATDITIDSRDQIIADRLSLNFSTWENFHLIDYHFQALFFRIICNSISFCVITYVLSSHEHFLFATSIIKDIWDLLCNLWLFEKKMSSLYSPRSPSPRHWKLKSVNSKTTSTRKIQNNRNIKWLVQLTCLHWFGSNLLFSESKEILVL